MKDKHGNFFVCFVIRKVVISILYLCLYICMCVYNKQDGLCRLAAVYGKLKQTNARQP